MKTQLIKRAIQNARKSAEKGGFPAGAVLVLNNEVVADGFSLGSLENDPTMHGEIDAIRKASQKLETSDLTGAVLYSSMEPCLMCFSAAYWAGVSEIVFASRKEKFSKDFYEGSINNQEINKENNRQLKLTFVPDFENEVIEIVNNTLKI